MKTSIGRITSNDDGDGFLTLSKSFLDEHPIYRLDVLQDILGLLTYEYRRAYVHMKLEWRAARKARKAEGLL